MQEMHSYLQVATKLAAYIVSLVLSWKMTNIQMVVTIGMQSTYTQLFLMRA